MINCPLSDHCALVTKRFHFSLLTVFFSSIFQELEIGLTWCISRKERRPNCIWRKTVAFWPPFLSSNPILYSVRPLLVGLIHSFWPYIYLFSCFPFTREGSSFIWSFVLLKKRPLYGLWGFLRINTWMLKGAYLKQCLVNIVSPCRRSTNFRPPDNVVSKFLIDCLRKMKLTFFIIFVLELNLWKLKEARGKSK